MTPEQRLELVMEAVDRFGVYLQNYANSLCEQNRVDPESLFQELWVYVMQKYPSDKILHVGHLRLSLYQRFVDAWRREKKMTNIEAFPEKEVPAVTLMSEGDEAQLRDSFFAEYPVELSELHKEILFRWARFGYTYKELSQQFDVPLSTIAEWTSQSREKIITYVNDELYSKS